MNDHEEKNKTPEGDHVLKKAVMMTVGTIANAVEITADVIGRAVTKENLDRLADKGEKAMQKVMNFGEETFKQVSEKGTQAVEAVKKAFKEEEKPAEEEQQKELIHIKDMLYSEAEILYCNMEEAVENIMSLPNKEASDRLMKQFFEKLHEQKDVLVAHLLQIKQEVQAEKEKAACQDGEEPVGAAAQDSDENKEG